MNAHQTRVVAAQPESVAALAQQLQSEYELLEMAELATRKHMKLRVKGRRHADQTMEDMK